MIWQENRYRSVLMNYETSQQLLEIWQEAYKGAYPAKAKPFGFVTIQELEKMRDVLDITEEHLLLDVGCGTGGPGLWVAEQTGARLIGIDLIPEAIAIARTKTQHFTLQHHARFLVQDVCEMAIPDLSLDAIISIDCLWMVLDKPLAFKELFRVSKSGAKVAFTTWTPNFMSIDSILTGIGFKVLLDEETPNWRERQMLVYRGIVARKKELELELGRDALDVLLAEATNAKVDLIQSTRRFIVLEKQACNNYPS